MHTTRTEVAPQLLQSLDTYFKKGGPNDNEYTELHSLLDEIYTACSNEEITVYELEAFKSLQDIFFDDASMIGHVRMRPFGYAGDFLIIDRFLSFRCINENYRKWDNYSFQCSAGQTLRNRKNYFKSLVKARAQKQKELRILNLASGPCRDIFELFEESPSLELKITCVDMDNSAIKYAQALLGKYAERVQFIQKNIFRFHTEEKFDIIWSGGMFDYFKNGMFVRILNKIGTWLCDGGELIVGNFNERHNPSRPFMEVLGGWCLHHRNSEELVDLALQAGFAPDAVRVKSEGENINLFLHCRKESDAL